MLAMLLSVNAQQRPICQPQKISESEGEVTAFPDSFRGSRTLSANYGTLPWALSR
jgi:hypothetical protein